jgi:hypothetical protein
MTRQEHSVISKEFLKHYCQVLVEKRFLIFGGMSSMCKSSEFLWNIEFFCYFVLLYLKYVQEYFITYKGRGNSQRDLVLINHGPWNAKIESNNCFIIGSSLQGYNNILLNKTDISFSIFQDSCASLCGFLASVVVFWHPLIILTSRFHLFSFNEAILQFTASQTLRALRAILFSYFRALSGSSCWPCRAWERHCPMMTFILDLSHDPSSIQKCGWNCVKNTEYSKIRKFKLIFG